MVIVQAEAELVRGRLLEGAGKRADAGAALRSAFYSAQLANHDHAQGEAAIELVYVAGYRESRFDEGKWWASIGVEASLTAKKQARPWPAFATLPQCSLARSPWPLLSW